MCLSSNNGNKENQNADKNTRNRLHVRGKPLHRGKPINLSSFRIQGIIPRALIKITHQVLGHPPKQQFFFILLSILLLFGLKFEQR